MEDTGDINGQTCPQMSPIKSVICHQHRNTGSIKNLGGNQTVSIDLTPKVGTKIFYFK